MKDSLSEDFMNAYKNSWEYLSDELMRLNLLIRRNLFQLGKPHHDGNYDEFMGLFLSDEEINGILDNKRQSSFTVDASEVRELDDSIKELEAQISERRAISLNEGIYLSLPRLSYLFHLTPVEAFPRNTLDSGGALSGKLRPSIRIRGETTFVS